MIVLEEKSGAAASPAGMSGGIAHFGFRLIDPADIDAAARARAPEELILNRGNSRRVSHSSREIRTATRSRSGRAAYRVDPPAPRGGPGAGPAGGARREKIASSIGTLTSIAFV